MIGADSVIRSATNDQKSDNFRNRMSNVHAYVYSGCNIRTLLNVFLRRKFHHLIRIVHEGQPISSVLFVLESHEEIEEKRLATW